MLRSGLIVCECLNICVHTYEYVSIYIDTSKVYRYKRSEQIFCECLGCRGYVAGIYMCMNICMQICVYIYVYTNLYIYMGIYAYEYIYIYICVYVLYIYVCIYICIYVYIYMYL